MSYLFRNQSFTQTFIRSSYPHIINVQVHVPSPQQNMNTPSTHALSPVRNNHGLYRTVVIEFRRRDSYVNVTQLCQQFGTTVTAYRSIRESLAQIQVVARCTSLPIDKEPPSKIPRRPDANFNQGSRLNPQQSQSYLFEVEGYQTFAHPLITFDIARWLSPCLHAVLARTRFQFGNNRSGLARAPVHYYETPKPNQVIAISQSQFADIQKQLANRITSGFSAMEARLSATLDERFAEKSRAYTEFQDHLNRHLQKLNIDGSVDERSGRKDLRGASRGEPGAFNALVEFCQKIGEGVYALPVDCVEERSDAITDGPKMFRSGRSYKLTMASLLHVFITYHSTQMSIQSFSRQVRKRLNITNVHLQPVPGIPIILSL